MTGKVVPIGVLALLVTACSSSPSPSDPGVAPQQSSAELTVGPTALPQGGEPVRLDPADFVTRVINPFLPLAPGTTWVYRSTDPEGAVETIKVTVTDQKKKIRGIDATVVRDVVTVDGKLKEDTYDWYAQDKHGSVWYLGEATKEFEDGKVSSTAGSWEHGIDGAQAGIIMPARPQVGMSYRQEYYAGEAEDAGQILSIDEKVDVPYGSFGRVVMTKDTTPLEPGLVEYKFYAHGVGPVLTVPVSGGGSKGELVSVRQ
jgi:hypothetical protein